MGASSEEPIAMRQTTLALACLFALAVGNAHAGESKEPSLSSHQCGLSTPYDLQVDDAGVHLQRRDGEPSDILFHDGMLRVDQQPQAISEADAARLREMEQQTRAMMPEVAGIAREAVEISFDALAGVTEAMTGSKRKARKIERYRERALAHVDDSLGQGRWNQDAFGEQFEAEVEEVADQMAGDIGRSALWAVFTGRAHRLEERADKLDIDQRIEARSNALETRAQALCTRLTAMRELQDALDYRYQGTPLQMLEPETVTAATTPPES